MAKDKKAKIAEKKARVAQKTEKKIAQKDKKASKKPDKDATETDSDDEDLDSVLAAYAKQQEQYLKVTETLTSPPSARSSASLIGSPSNANELLLFGGEYYNGALAKFYNDLFVYNVRRDTWTLVTSPNTPLPRSGHAWTRGGNAGGVYLFGGEFSSPKQGTFYHYNDFWRLDPNNREWSKIEATSSGSSSQREKGPGKAPTAPSARSGHRMTYYKQYILLFGGFQDTSSTTKYLNDLWLYDTASFVWHTPTLPPASARPDARSSFSFLPRDDGAVLFGGYSRVKASVTTGGAKGSGGKGGKGMAAREVSKPLVHQDVWHLKITAPPVDAAAESLPTVRWEKRKRPVNSPNPPRAGATMAFHKGRGIQFGGVHDVENSEEGIESEFFNGLAAWNIERNRYFALALRRPRAQGKGKVQHQERLKRGRGKADEEALLENLRQLELKDGVMRDQPEDIDVPKDEEGENEGQRTEKPILWEMPYPRFNAQLTVQDDVLYIFGGTFEKAEREYTFDEMWSIDLGSLAGCKEIFKRELDDWQGEESESESEGDELDDSEDLFDEERPHDSLHLASPIAAQDSPPGSSLGNHFETDLHSAESGPSEAALTDDLPQPRPFESLRDFYARTSQQWQEILLEDLKAGGVQRGKSIKEVRKGAFERAEHKWWDSREEIQGLEDEQEEAGIGEIVNLADKAKTDTASGIGRRR